MEHKELLNIPVAIYRCGTSKGIFIRKENLPKDELLRDKVILAIFGSPDKRQIDGLGGAEILTSKLAVIGPSTVPDADVDYLFGQVAIDSPYISYSGMCGNISAGVAPYAIEEGLVAPVEPVTKVRVHSVNLDRIFVVEVPVQDGYPVVSGNYVVPGVPGTGAKLNIDMSGMAGSFGRGILPTGNVKDSFFVDGVGTVTGSLVDVTNPCFFIKAEDLDLKGDEVKRSDFKTGKLEQLESIRKMVFKILNKPYDEKDAVPFIAFVHEPMDYIDHLTGKKICKEDVDFLSRLYMLGGIHQTYAGSISCCTGAAAVIPGTVVNEVCRKKSSNEVLIGHPAGIIDVEAECRNEEGNLVIDRLTYARTARRIMDGTCYVRKSVLGGAKWE